MPVLGYYTVTFARKGDSELRLDVDIAVGDGEHPPVDRAKEYLARVGFDPELWSFRHSRERDTLEKLASYRQYRA